MCKHSKCYNSPNSNPERENAKDSTSDDDSDRSDTDSDDSDKEEDSYFFFNQSKFLCFSLIKITHHNNLLLNL